MTVHTLSAYDECYSITCDRTNDWIDVPQARSLTDAKRTASREYRDQHLGSTITVAVLTRNYADGPTYRHILSRRQVGYRTGWADVQE